MESFLLNTYLFFLVKQLVHGQQQDSFAYFKNMYFQEENMQVFKFSENKILATNLLKINLVYTQCTTFNINFYLHNIVSKCKELKTIGYNVTSTLYAAVNQVNVAIRRTNTAEWCQKLANRVIRDFFKSLELVESKEFLLSSAFLETKDFNQSVG